TSRTVASTWSRRDRSQRAMRCWNSSAAAGPPAMWTSWSTPGSRPGADSRDASNADLGSTTVYLKSLTPQGVKAIAAPTTPRSEPGICCVVGPNGSGKSNVVDALTWVMGEHSAKSLRGGKMQDVIFAGTAGKQPLGRAEVTLTLDTSDGALPIDYA